MRRREDGYHDLASLFHVIDLGDDMGFEELAGTAAADALTCNMEGVPIDESNLVIKVRAVLQAPRRRPSSTILCILCWVVCIGARNVCRGMVPT